jgi:phosphatidylserine/phosphatidylglycerophosphate/cardiolipin synthase-like enzyme
MLAAMPAMKSIYFLSALLLSGSIQAQQAHSPALADGLTLTQENPLTPYALKKNGKNKKRFKVPYKTIADYYQFISQGTILENPNPPKIMDIDMDVVHSREVDELEFYVSLKNKKAYPALVINPHTVTQLFVVDPKAYNQLAGQEDFVSAKQEIYKTKGFQEKNLQYERNIVHLEDWRSLNHPPVHELGNDLTVWDKSLAPIDYESITSPYFEESFQKQLDLISASELSFGNRTELLENGDSYERKLTEVKKGKKFILMAVMSFFCDESSRKLEDLLIEKAKEGLDVKLIVEKVWTKLAMKRCLNRMIDGGVDVALANDLLKKGDAQALFHDKFIVVDENLVIAGGANIMASNNISTGYNHMNRDNDLLIEGPMAADAIDSFNKLFRSFRGKRNIEMLKLERVKTVEHYEALVESLKQDQREKGQRGQDLYEAKLSDKVARNQGVCRFITQSPQTDKHKISKVMIELVNRSQSKMNMTNGNVFYFDHPDHKEKERKRETWNKKLFKSIFAATERGVKLDIIGNGIDGGYGEASNMFKRMYLKNRYRINPLPRGTALILADFMDKMAAKKNQPYLEFLAQVKNIRAWTHFQYMHSKKFQFDRIVNVVSSYNLEEWSGDKSHESAVVCLDDKLSKQMERSFLLDVVNSQPANTKKPDTIVEIN